MAITTYSEKFSMTTWQKLWEMPLPIEAASSFTDGDKQHLIAEFSGTTWSAPSVIKPWIAFQVIRQTINN